MIPDFESSGPEPALERHFNPPLIIELRSQSPIRSAERRIRREDMELEMRKLKLKISEKRREYENLLNANITKAEKAVALETKIESIRRIRTAKEIHVARCVAPAELPHLHHVADALSASITSLQERNRKLREQCVTASLALTNTKRNLEVKIQETWRLVKEQNQLEAQLKGSVSLNILIPKLCDRCVERMSQTVFSASLRGSTNASTRKPDGNFPVVQDTPCVGCTLL